MKNNLTIIIPTLNSTGDVAQDKKIHFAFANCLSSLGETVPDIPVIVASNGNDPGYLPMYLHPKSTRINLWEQGQCKAVNAAVAMTNTEWIMVSNDDMIYPPNWTEPIEFNNYQCFSLKLVEPNDGAPTFIKYDCGGAGGDFDNGKFLEFNKDWKGKSWQTGFNLPFIIRRDLWDKIGGYDINYDPWGASSDTDLQCKIELAGIRTMQSQASLVYHFSQTSGTFNPSKHDYWQKNYDYFREKWGYERPGGDDVWNSRNLIDFNNLKYHPWWEGYYEKKS